MLAHNVFFSLNDPSEPAKQTLLDACKRYLASHEGILFFACGTLASDLNRPVNDRDFDVALHITFRSKEDHDRYQDAPLHHRFVSENKANWKKVRVFDSVVEKAPGS
jgi:Stress responsive A/B Barrel Domain